MPRKSAKFGDDLTPPTTPGSVRSLPEGSSARQRSQSREESVSQPTSSRVAGNRSKRQRLSSDAASFSDDRPQSHASSSSVSAHTARIDLSQSPSNDIVPDKSSPLQTKGAREARPLPPQAESAPILGGRRPDQLSENKRATTDPGPDTPNSKERRSKMRKEKVEQMTVHLTDSKIEEIIGEPIRRVEDLQKQGRAYIMVVEIAGRQLVKIGQTGGAAYTRADKISKGCVGTVKVKNCYDSGELLFYKKVETLAQTELSMSRAEFDCACSVAHTEYFDLDGDSAVRVVRRWSDFCSRVPYNRAGQLSKVWRNRLNGRARLDRNVDDRDTDQLSAVWDQFTNVTWASELLDEVRVAIENFNRHGSPVPTMFATLALLHLNRGSTLALVIHIMSILWFSVKAMTEDSPLSARIFRKVFNVSPPWETRQVLPTTDAGSNSTSKDTKKGSDGDPRVYVEEDVVSEIGESVLSEAISGDEGESEADF